MKNYLTVRDLRSALKEAVENAASVLCCGCYSPRNAHKSLFNRLLSDFLEAFPEPLSSSLKYYVNQPKDTKITDHNFYFQLLDFIKSHWQQSIIDNRQLGRGFLDQFIILISPKLLALTSLTYAEQRRRLGRFEFGVKHVYPYPSYQNTIGFSDLDSFIYRGDNRPPETIFKAGFTTQFLLHRPGTSTLFRICETGAAFFYSGGKPAILDHSYSTHAIAFDRLPTNASTFPVRNDCSNDVTYVYEVCFPNGTRWLDTFKVDVMTAENYKFTHGLCLEIIPADSSIPSHWIRRVFKIERKFQPIGETSHGKKAIENFVYRYNSYFHGKTLDEVTFDYLKQMRDRSLGWASSLFRLLSELVDNLSTPVVTLAKVVEINDNPNFDSALTKNVPQKLHVGDVFNPTELDPREILGKYIEQTLSLRPMNFSIVTPGELRLTTGKEEEEEEEEGKKEKPEVTPKAKSHSASSAKHRRSRRT